MTTNAGWRAWLEAALEAQDAYHIIQDTPIQEFETKREIIVERMTRAREAYRRAQTYPLPNLRLEVGCEEDYDKADDLRLQLGRSFVKVSGDLMVVYGIDQTGGERDCRTARGSILSINSSRGKRVVLLGRGFIGEFLAIVNPASDRFDPANLLMRVKR